MTNTTDAIPLLVNPPLLLFLPCAPSLSFFVLSLSLSLSLFLSPLLSSSPPPPPSLSLLALRPLRPSRRVFFFLLCWGVLLGCVLISLISWETRGQIPAGKPVILIHPVTCHYIFSTQAQSFFTKSLSS